MTTFGIYAVGAALLLTIGIRGALRRKHLLRRILALNIIGGGAFLFLVLLGYRESGEAGPDPVPQALVLTGIVVAVSISSFAIVIARRLNARTGRTELPEEGLD
ncbi:MAG: hypothetical protein GEU90_14790 [Gemmatimonas sp.]|nr:hypothetical protein [Gemmatimonas sp.]